MRVVLSALCLVMIFSLSACGTKLEGSSANQRSQIRAMESDTLQKLYAQHPAAQREIQRSVGYAVFDSSGGKFLYGGLDHGNGVVIDNRSHKRTYMKMFELQPGFGFGFANFRLIFLFTTRSAMDDFVNSGWEFGARAAAAAKDKTQGGAAEAGYNVSPGITLYQLTEEGAIAGISITGAKYWRNDDLNQP
jgi:lipid-binding SYLF domain-containing protein